MFGQALAAFLLAFPALFSIVNPPGGAIIFNEVTSGHSHAQRVSLARTVALYSTIVMLGALLLGTYVLSFFGISLDALRIAGGLVVSVRAYEMLSAPDDTAARKQNEARPVEAAPMGNLGGYAFFPLTLPFTTGPGTIAVAISLGTARPDQLEAAGAFYAGAALAVLAMAAIIWASYAMADRLAAFLGDTGRVVASRLAAFLLLGIGVQIALNGIIPVLHRALGS
ncbi:MAG TPA: NAAT family transporter [Acidocella sp.]|jgi:multiple antibiotic resistance protein|nr:NAAT family transporter [Acidocella sp.]